VREKGLEQALQIGRKILAGGGTALDAVEQVIRSLENDPAFNAGFGAVLTSDKRAELDAAIMDGRQRGCGAVAGVTNVANPITLARRVMTETKHVLLIGSGADQFARQQQMPLVEASYFQLSGEQTEQSLYLTKEGAQLGTVGCVAMDIDGNLAAGTSTGGIGGQMPGRVGDCPIFGAGTYADNNTCAISATGVGEEFIRNVIAYDIAAQIQYADRTMSDAIASTMSRRMKPDTGGLIAISPDGTISLFHNTPGMSCGAADSHGRFEVLLRKV
jgi:beta-aspartyl-peptidase (threonine type)